MIASLVTSVFLQQAFQLDSAKPKDWAWIMLITVAVTTVVWLATTFLTRPEPEETLVAFYRRTRPGAAGWGPIAAKAPEVRQDHDGAANLFCWLAGAVMIYSALFGTGKVIFGEYPAGFGMLALAALSGWLIYRNLNRRGWSSVVD